MTVSLFPHISGSHPFGRELDLIRDAVNRDERVARVLQRAGAGEPLIHAEIKAVPKPEGGFRFDRFYWSAQVKSRDAPGGLLATTLAIDPKKGDPAWALFPEDSYLAGAASYLAQTTGVVRDVLRYVPLRRLTFVETGGDGARRIGKFKRRSRYQQAYGLLHDIADAVRRAKVDFTVSVPLEVDHANALYFQTSLAGTPVPDLVTDPTARSLFEDMGRIHAELHSVPAWASLPHLKNGALLERAVRDVALIEFYVEEMGAALKPLLPRLAAHCPDDAETAVCHGDFVPSQLLLDGARWSIIDFDLVTLADPYHDLSIFIASLDYDVAWIEARPSEPWKERFAEHYLVGYAARRGVAIERRRLSWHCMAAEIYYLALMLKKDRFDMARAKGRIARVLALAEEVS